MPGAGDSYGTARELMRYLLRLEQGRLVDVFSSREIKRLIYLTEVASATPSSPALAAVGRVLQVRLAVPVRERSRLQLQAVRGQRQELHEFDGDRRVTGRRTQAVLHRTLVTNILRKNSAGEHQALAIRLQQLILTNHGAK